jgi:hypothetical protein
LQLHRYLQNLSQPSGFHSLYCLRDLTWPSGFQSRGRYRTLLQLHRYLQVLSWPSGHCRILLQLQNLVSILVITLTTDQELISYHLSR